MGLIDRLRARYGAELGPREILYQTDPEPAWSFALAGARAPVVRITHAEAMHCYQVTISTMDEFLLLDDRTDDALTAFVEACARGGLVMVRSSAGIWREWCLRNRDGVDVSRSRGGWESGVVAAWRRFVAALPGYREERIPLEPPPGAARVEDSPEEYARSVTAEFVSRLSDMAASRGLSPAFANTTRRIFGQDGVPRVDVSDGPNTVTTFWPETRLADLPAALRGGARRRAGPTSWVLLRASVVPAAVSRRVETLDVPVFLDDATLARMLALLQGEGRIAHGPLSGDELVLGEGRDGLRLRLWRGPVSIDDYARWLGEVWAARVNAAADRQNTSVTSAFGLADAFGEIDVPHLVITADGNRVTLWPEDEKEAQYTVDVVVPSVPGRIRTEDWGEAWPVGDAELDQVVRLLRGEGRLVRQRGRVELVVGEGRSRLRLSVQEGTALPTGGGDGPP